MNAKNGELAIARFDSEEHVCFVTGRDKSQTKFVWWEHKANCTTMYPAQLPKSRVVSAAPKPGKELIFLGGEFCKLTIDDVVPATVENIAALCLSVSVYTSNVKLGGCYHTGKAYCLGYRNGHGEEVELDDQLFTCLDGGIEGGAEAALKRHTKEFPQRDVPRFIVELAAVKIIDEDTRNDDYCSDCGRDGCICDESFCCDCGELQEECTCGEVCVDCGEELEPNKCYCDCCCDDEDCLHCGLYPLTCGCWDNSLEGGCMGDDDLDDENVDKTFRPMNAFTRARWLKARGSQ